MSQAPIYVRTTDFSDDELLNVGGRSTVRTAQLDAELDALGLTANALRTNQSLNQRDDGEIRDGRVKVFTLASDVLALLTSYGAVPRGPWVTATLYTLKDLVSQSGNTYIAVTTHTSGVFATDLAAGKWLLFSLSAAPSATQVTFTPGATISATNVQTAIDETDTENRALSAAALAAATAYDTAMRADLISSTDVAKGDALVMTKSTLANAVAATLHQVNEERVSVFRFFSAGQIADVISNTGVVNVQTVMQNAITALGAIGKRPYMPAGTYLFDTVTSTVPMEVETEGFATIIKRTTTSLSSTPHWAIQSNFKIGNITGVGNISNDTGQQCPMFQITPGASDIDFVEFNSIKGSGYRGDILYIDGRPATKIKKISWKVASGSNMWRATVSLIGATDVQFEGVDGGNSSAYAAFNIEPNPGVSQATFRVRGGYVIGGRVQFAGDPSIKIGDVQIGFWDVDASALTNSTPVSSLYDATKYLQGGANFGRIKFGEITDANSSTMLAADYHASNGGILEVDRWVGVNNSEATFKCHIRDDGLDELRIGSGAFTPSAVDRYIAKGAAATRRKIGYLGRVSSTGGGFSFGANNVFENLQIACAGNPAFVSITKSQWNNCNVTACSAVVSACSDYQFKGGAFTYSGGSFDTAGSVRPTYDGLTMNGVTFSPEVPVVYSATMAINALAGSTFVIPVTNNSNFTISDPTEGYIGQRITIRVKNISGGAIGTATFGTHYKLATWSQPANGNYRSANFEYDGTQWVEQSRTAVDISN